MRTILAFAAALVMAASAAKAQEGKLTLYTSQPNTDAQRTVDAFHARYPKIEIGFLRDGTPRLLAKLRAEIEAGRAQSRRPPDRRQRHHGGAEARGPAAPL